jgi:hypothetical protein
MARRRELADIRDLIRPKIFYLANKKCTSVSGENGSLKNREGTGTKRVLKFRIIFLLKEPCTLLILSSSDT